MIDLEVASFCHGLMFNCDIRWDERDLAGLRAFLSATPRAKAAILAHNGTEAVKLGDRLWAIPVGLLLA
jgi:hypothetical protein